MSITRPVYSCKVCNGITTTWCTRCPACGASLALVRCELARRRTDYVSALVPGPEFPRLHTGISAVDTALSGGLEVNTRTVLYARQGLGKTTLALQLCAAVPRAIFACGEMRRSQLAALAARLGIDTQGILCVDTQDTDELAHAIAAERPDLWVVDSWQVFSSPRVDGRAGLLRQCAHVWQSVARLPGTGVLISQMRDAGPALHKRLLHAVDAEISLRGDPTKPFRALVVHKSRFCAAGTHDLVMTARGLESFAAPVSLAAARKRKRNRDTHHRDE